MPECAAAGRPWRKGKRTEDVIENTGSWKNNMRVPIWIQGLGARVRVAVRLGAKADAGWWRGRFRWAASPLRRSPSGEKTRTARAVVRMTVGAAGAIRASSRGVYRA